LIEDLAQMKFVKNMNILNLVVDKEAIKIIGCLIQMLEGKD
jgi:hypothetical protein